MRVAAISFEVRSDTTGFYEELEATIGRAVESGASLIVLPELVILGRCAGDPDTVAGHAQEFVSRLTSMSQDHGVTIVGGSHIERRGEALHNVCAVAMPDGEIHRVDKHVLTQWERHEWMLVPGSRSTPIGDLGVLICYDSEFPELARPLCRQGVRVLCVPAYTETQQGFQRVRWGCLARAVENQVFVVHASLVGSLGGEPVPSTYGSSAVIAPSMPPFPESAILEETPLNEPAIAIADLDFGDLECARTRGDVRNWTDYLDAF